MKMHHSVETWILLSQFSDKKFCEKDHFKIKTCWKIFQGNFLVLPRLCEKYFVKSTLLCLFSKNIGFTNFLWGKIPAISTLWFWTHSMFRPSSKLAYPPVYTVESIEDISVVWQLYIDPLKNWKNHTVCQK